MLGLVLLLLGCSSHPVVTSNIDLLTYLSGDKLTNLLQLYMNNYTVLVLILIIKGLDGTVLPFLRAEGKINLRFMPKRDVKIHLREILEGRKTLKEEQDLALSKVK